MAPHLQDHADPIDVAVGLRIRLSRRTRGLTQQALADAVGVSFQQIQKYERGANRVSASMLARIAQTLDLPVAELFGASDATHGLTEELSRLLDEAGAIELLRAYHQLPRPWRATLVALVSAASRAGADA